MILPLLLHVMSKKLARIVLIAQKPLQIQEKLFYEKITEIWQRIHATTKISVLLLIFMSNIVFCQKYERSQFVVLTKLAKSAQIAKIRPLLFTKLFLVQEWKWPYFWNSVKFWYWKWCLKIANFKPPRELKINTIKWSGTKPEGVISDMSTCVSNCMRI